MLDSTHWNGHGALNTSKPLSLAALFSAANPSKNKFCAVLASHKSIARTVILWTVRMKVGMRQN